jgi:hypothetical protein
LVHYVLPLHPEEGVELLKATYELTPSFGALNEEETLISALDQSHSAPHANSSFNLIACQHPYLNSNRPQRAYSFVHAHLQLVFYSSHTNKHHALLQAASAFSYFLITTF